MGRIKTTLVKRSTKKIVKEHGEGLSADFEKNKQAIKKVVDISSKKLRNIVAGYATRLTRKKEQEV